MPGILGFQGRAPSALAEHAQFDPALKQFWHRIGPTTVCQDFPFTSASSTTQSLKNAHVVAIALVAAVCGRSDGRHWRTVHAGESRLVEKSLHGPHTVFIVSRCKPLPPRRDRRRPTPPPPSLTAPGPIPVSPVIVKVKNHITRHRIPYQEGQEGGGLVLAVSLSVWGGCGSPTTAPKPHPVPLEAGQEGGSSALETLGAMGTWMRKNWARKTPVRRIPLSRALWGGDQKLGARKCPQVLLQPVAGLHVCWKDWCKQKPGCPP